MDFRSFNAGKDNTTRRSLQDSLETKTREAYARYGDMSESEVIEALFSEVSKERSEGVFDINKIWSFYRSIAPMLSDEQRTKMRNIISAIETNR